MLQVREMYAERDGKGRPVWSMMKLADHFGVGETTIFRAVKSVGGFAADPQPLARSAELTDAAGASAAKLLDQLKNLNKESGS